MTAGKVLGVVAFGVGLLSLYALRGKASTQPQTLFVKAALNPAVAGRPTLEYKIAAVYRTAEGDVTQYLSLPGSAPFLHVVLTAQRLASCVLRTGRPLPPTQLWALRVTQGGLLVSSYRRPPGQAFAAWEQVAGQSLSELTLAAPTCREPFCTNDAARLAQGSEPCS